jgi:thiol-disulfide isomerase/thioredoxin
MAVPFLLLVLGIELHAADAPQDHAPKPGEPTDAKARKTWDSALDWEKKGYQNIAIDELRQANKEDGGHCAECLRRALSMSATAGTYNDAVEIAHDWLALAQNDAEKAVIHSMLGEALQMQGINHKNSKYLMESCDEYKAALALDVHAPLMHFGYGVSLAHLHRDDAARAEFRAFLEQDQRNPSLHRRTERYLERIELARFPMAPAFTLTTLDGQQIGRDSLAGKVVLIDFWATWCGSCREAMPHIREIARKFDGQPLVVLSVSLDRDQGEWKSFVRRNGMTWPQYYDGYFVGPMAGEFGVSAIPATFTIDADGILEDQHIGDANIEGKLKKLIAGAAEATNRKSAPAADK